MSSRVADLRRPAPFPSAHLALARNLAIPCAGMPPNSAPETNTMEGFDNPRLHMRWQAKRTHPQTRTKIDKFHFKP
eukprot:3987983-Amphidinium_carterae.1